MLYKNVFFLDSNVLYTLILVKSGNAYASVKTIIFQHPRRGSFPQPLHPRRASTHLFFVSEVNSQIHNKMASVFGKHSCSFLCLFCEYVNFNDAQWLFCYLVGNIPYNVSEEQLKAIFSEAGPVVSFRYFFTELYNDLVSYIFVICRIVQDRETGRSRGFGFCEFQSPDSAQVAMRNLNGYELNGRSLRVDSANRK